MCVVHVECQQGKLPIVIRRQEDANELFNCLGQMTPAKSIETLCHSDAARPTTNRKAIDTCRTKCM